MIVPIPAVNAVVFNAEREILLTLRSARVREPGKWCLPGGHVEIGESLVTAMRREVAEETGLVVKAERLIGLYSDPKLTVTHEPLPQGYHGQFVTAVFEVLAYEGGISPNDEVADWDWFAPENLPEPTLKSHPVRVQDASRFCGEVFVR